MPNESATIDQLQLALALLQQGRLSQADAICRQVLAIRPHEFHALHILGIVALQLRDPTAAERWFRAAIAANPDQAPAHSNLSAVLLAGGRPEEALEQSELAVRLNADSAEAWSNRANALGELRRTQESLASYDRGIALAPGLLAAHLGRGNLLLRMQRFEAAIESYDRALEISPDHLEALNNRGLVLLNLHRAEEALVMFERALRTSPGFVDALSNRGSALRRLRRPREAIDSYHQALRLQPDSPDVLCNMGNVFLGFEMLDEALSCCNRALALQPELAEALNIRATALRDLRRAEEAADCYSQLVRAAPEFDYAIGNLTFARANNCDWSNWFKEVTHVIDAVQAGKRACLPFSFLSMSECAGAQLHCARTFVADRCPPAAALPRPRARHHQRIRVAYVSGDFGDHAVSFLLAGLFERHDRSRFETFAVSLRPEQPSAMGQRVKRAFAQFIDVSERSDLEVGALLAEREIDIAVDLVGFTAGMRPEIFAGRAAPIQVNYLGFPATMAAEFMDYLIADEFVVPPGLRGQYSEKIVYLPECFQCYDDRREVAAATPSRAEVGLPEGAPVFCSFNSSYKISSTVFDVWLRLLAQVPASVLWLVGGRDVVRRNLQQQAQDRGVDPARLVFATRCAYREHLARLPLADLFLDSLPFNAGATASDALSMGLPVLTATGEAFAARMAGSLLRTVGLSELIAGSLEEYETKALSLAHRPDELRSLRQRLIAARHTSSLFDTDRFRRHLESAYERMWERWQRGEAPESFSVPRRG
jgi:protein O-GlcNAc transferase